MKFAHALRCAAVGALMAEALVGCAALLWARLHYTVGFSQSALWDAAVVVAAAGAALGLIVYGLRPATWIP